MKKFQCRKELNQFIGAFESVFGIDVDLIVHKVGLAILPTLFIISTIIMLGIGGYIAWLKI